MEKRYFIQCSYDGTNYSGWQKQPNAVTVQEVVEERFYRLFSCKTIGVVGCGRTDAGVHATQFWFHVDLNPIFSSRQLELKLNNMLPRDISVLQIQEVASNFHARFDATKRTYRYFIHSKKSPFLQNYSWHFTREVSLEKMNEAAKILLGRQDFTSFSKLHTDVNNNFCEIYNAEWRAMENQIYFEISANRFLRNMVRAIVGTLLQVGTKEISREGMQEIITKKDRAEAGRSVPAKGLFLHQVDYPFLEAQ